MSNEEISSLDSRIDAARAEIARMKAVVRQRQEKRRRKQQQPERAVIEDILTDSIEDRRALMQYRLNMLYRVVWPLTQQESDPRLQLEAIDRILVIMDLECKLWGLYKQPAQPTVIREARVSIVA